MTSAPPNDDFNIYGKHKKLTDEEARKAAAQLQEILHLLPNGKTEYTASKTVTIDTAGATGQHTGPAEIPIENVDLQTYGLPNDIGNLESLSHTESITAAYGPPSQHYGENPSDIYRQMAKKQTPEEIYIQKHPNEGYDYRPTPAPENNAYKWNNYHAAGGNNNPIKDLTPIIAALEVAKRRDPTQQQKPISTQYSIEKSVYKVPSVNVGTQSGGYNNYLPPVVEKSKYTYFDPAEQNADNNYRPVYTTSYKVVRQKRQNQHKLRSRVHEYDINDPLLFNRLFVS